MFDAERPIILNGIEDTVTRPDLADRAIFLHLEPIPENARKPETELWAAFESERPELLGALLDIVVHGLKNLSETRLEMLPRMADFALWATACETAKWSTVKFEAAFNSNRDDAVENVIEASPVAVAIRNLMTKRTEWTGTATELLGVLGDGVDETVRKAKSWPATAALLSNQLRRSATPLRSIGINIEKSRAGDRSRTKFFTISSQPDNKEL